MKTGIFETEHFEVAYPMIRALDMPGNELVIFVNSSTYRHLSDLLGNNIKRYHWVIQDSNKSNRAFIWQVFRVCKKENLQALFLNTVSAHFILYGWMAALLPSVRIILTLHDANNFFRSRFSLYPRRMVRHIGKKVLARFCYAYIAMSEAMLQHIKTFGVNKPLIYLPAAVFERGDNALQAYEQGARLRIAVPGSIDGRRRNYDQVFELLDRINQRSLPIDIVLAGGPYAMYGEAVMKRCRAYGKSHSNLVYYESPVMDQPSFDKELRHCHFIWTPSVIRTIIADGIEEIYGLSKSSGNVCDAIRHARPLLAPRELVIPDQLQSSAYLYESLDALLFFLQEMVASPGSYENWSRRALSNAKAYNADGMREKIKLLL